MRDWLTSKAYDDWKCNPPEYDDTEETLFCECGEPIESGDRYYIIDDCTYCEDCAQAWLDEHSFVAGD